MMLGSYDWPFVRDNSSNIPFPIGSTTPAPGSSFTSFVDDRFVTGYSYIPVDDRPFVMGYSYNPFGSQATASASSPVYKYKSDEELRWEAYQLGDKGLSGFGQKAAFGGFGSTPTQKYPFGSAIQPPQPAFGSSSTTPFGASSQPTFCSTEAPAFGATRGFGSTPTQTNPFGSVIQPSQPAFGSSIFGSATTPFAASSRPAFCSTEAPAFGATRGFGSTPTQKNPFGSAIQSSQPAFGSSIFGPSTTLFGASSQPALCSTEAPAFGATRGFGSTTQTSPFRSALQPSQPAFGSSIFGSSTTPFVASSQPTFC